MNRIRILILIVICTGFGLPAMAQERVRPFRLTLADALQKANTVNLQVMMANARLEGAIARITTAQSDLLPHVEGVVSGARQTGDLRAGGINFPGLGPHFGPYNNFDARGRVTVAIFDPSAFERFQAAKKGETLSKAEVQKTREDVLALVAMIFVDAERKQQTVRLLKTLLDKDQMAYELSQENLAQGTGTQLDSNNVQSELDQTKYLFTQAKLQAEDACLDLEAALQLPLDEPLVLIDDKDILKTLEEDAKVNFKDVSNADTALASSQLEFQKADQKTAYADFLPKVSGRADYGRSGQTPDRGSNTYFVGLQATVPIWEGGTQQAKVKEAKAKVKEAEENLTDAGQQEQVNVAKARIAIREAYDLRRAKYQKRRTAQRSMLIALHALRIGTGTALGVMQAKASLALAEDEFNEARATLILSHIDLLHAQGRLRELVKQEGE